MHTYTTTPKGVEIAHASGLDALADRLVAQDNHGPLVYQPLDFNDPFKNDPEEVERPAIRSSLSVISDQEAAPLVRGLRISDADKWKYTEGGDIESLFPYPNIHSFMPASHEDSLVLSGVIGLQYLNRRAQCALLAKSRFREFGFTDMINSAGFVGAYVLGKLVDSGRGSLFYYPEATFAEGTIEHSIGVGATSDGDLRIREKKRLLDNILDPTGRSVLFSPVQETLMGSYHSMEPDITYAMLSNAYLTEGKKGMTTLVNCFWEKLHQFINDDGRINYRRGPFGDYGSSDLAILKGRMRYLVSQSSEQRTRRSTRAIVSEPYLPQSKMLFEVFHREKGLSFENRVENTVEPTGRIDIPREFFPDLFALLIKQAQAGLGRTSPHQHIELLMTAKEILCNN